MGSPSRPDAVERIVARLFDRLDELGEALIRRYREEIVDYSALKEQTLFGDVRTNALTNLNVLLTNVGTDRVAGPDQLDELRRGAARRVRQGVSLESLLQSYRIWGRTVWNEVMLVANRDDPAEREAALQLADRVMRHVDFLSIAAAAAYEDAAEGLWSDREILRRDLLEALLAGRVAPEHARRQAGALNLSLDQDYVVILGRREEGAWHDPAGSPTGHGISLRELIALARTHLQVPERTVLIGARQGELVALVPLDSVAALPRVKELCRKLADAAHGFSIGIGGWHPGLSGIRESYAEARAAADAALHGRAGVPVAFDDIIIEYIVRNNEQAQRFLEDTLKPISRYDEQHHSQLLETLQTYIDSMFNLTRCARRLFVNPNTVVYRLKRINEITGRDFTDTNDLLILMLASKISPGG